VDSNFVLLEFDETIDDNLKDKIRLPPTVFVEGLAANQHMERKADVDRYKEAIDYLRYSALNARDSIEHIRSARKRIGGVSP
jgi:hypothetical protein